MPFAGTATDLIAYDRAGTGDPVVLLAGTGMASAAWRASGLTGALLAAGFEVITVTARGLAPSSGSGPFTIQQFVSDALAVISHAGLTNICVVGYSLGSFIAETLARALPDLVSSLVLVAGAGATSPISSLVHKAEEDLLGLLGHIPESVATALGLLTGLPPATLASAPATVAAWSAQLSDRVDWASPSSERGQSEVNGEWLADLTRSQRVQEITAPTLVIAFEHDPLFPPRLAADAAEQMPSGVFSQIGGAAHLGLFTDGGCAVAAISDFLVTTRLDDP